MTFNASICCWLGIVPLPVASIAAETFPRFEIRWQRADRAVVNPEIRVVHLGGSTLLATDVRGSGLLRSVDGGSSWIEVMFAPRDTVVAMTATQDGHAFVLTRDGLVSSSADAGQSWQERMRFDALENGVVADVIVTGLAEVVVAVASAKKVTVFRSNGDASPLKTADLPNCSSARFLRVGNGILLVGTDGRVLKSHDGGSTWISQAQVGAVANANAYIGTAYVLQSANDGRILRSGDQGETWESISHLSTPASDFAHLAPGVVLAASGGKIRLSFDYAKSWSGSGASHGLPADAQVEHFTSWERDEIVGVTAIATNGTVWCAEISRRNLYLASREVNHRNDATITAENNAFRSGVVAVLRAPGVFAEPEDIAVDATHAYIPSRDGNNVAVVDIRDLRSPVVAATIRDSEMLDVFGVEKHGHVLYATSLTNHSLLIFDVTKPEVPRRLSALQVGGKGSRYARLTKAFYQDGLLYLTHRSEGALYIVDVRDPAAPRVVGRTNAVQGAFAVAVHRGYAYIGGCYPGHGIAVVDVSDPAAPRVVRTLEDPENFACTCSFQIAGDALVAVAYASNTLLVFDISDPPTMALRSSMKGNGIDGPNRVVLTGSDAYVVNAADDSLMRIDVSDLDRPRATGLWTDMLLEKVYGIGTAQGKLFLVARDAENLVVVDPARLKSKL